MSNCETCRHWYRIATPSLEGKGLCRFPLQRADAKFQPKVDEAPMFKLKNADETCANVSDYISNLAVLEKRGERWRLLAMVETQPEADEFIAMIEAEGGKVGLFDMRREILPARLDYDLAEEPKTGGPTMLHVKHRQETCQL